MKLDVSCSGCFLVTSYDFCLASWTVHLAFCVHCCSASVIMSAPQLSLDTSPQPKRMRGASFSITASCRDAIVFTSAATTVSNTPESAHLKHPENDVVDLDLAYATRGSCHGSRTSGAESISRDYASTELDSESETAIAISSDSDEADTNDDEFGKTDDAVAFWLSADSRFAIVCHEINQDPRIVFNFAPLKHRTNFPEQLTHCRNAIDSVLAKGFVRSFKVGITFTPLHRFRNARYAYVRQGYKQMMLLFCDDDPEAVTTMEIELLKVYRMHSRSGLINPSGHVLCANRAPGGESGHHGVSPFFVYSVFSWNSIAGARMVVDSP